MNNLDKQYISILNQILTEGLGNPIELELITAHLC